MSEEELFERIAKELYVDDRDHGKRYTHAKAAEYLERVMYVCPHCGLAHFRSEGDTVQCLDCGMKARYLPDLTFESLEGDFPYRTVKDWYDAQCEFVNNLDLLGYSDMPIYEDEAQLSEVIVYKRKELLKEQVSVKLYGDRIVIDDTEYPFRDVMAVVILGKNKVNIYHGQRIYQLKGGKRFNGLKYVNIYHRYKNLVSENENGKFLGL